MPNRDFFGGTRGEMRRAILFLIFIPLILVIIGCGGDGTGGGSDGEDYSGGGWVTIEDPTTEPTISTNCDHIYIGGEAFISPTWYRCCSGSAEDTGVTVTWRNITSGESGNADQSVDICYFFGSPYLCNHRWGATVPLALGENQITVSASDPSGVSGHSSITVSKPEASFSINGRVTNTLDIGLWNSGISGFKLTLTGTDQNTSVFTNRYGSYSFSCVQNGSYTITPSSTINFIFTPANRSVTVSDADVTSQDFVTEAYFISGSVTSTTGIGISGIQVSLAGTNASATYFTDPNAYYIFAVPNGSYTITPSYCDWLGCYSITPAARDVIVDYADVTGQDFVRQ
ncbi:MAG: carboxypeptidase-like regulatory domain-containing protein [bacterium]